MKMQPGIGAGRDYREQWQEYRKRRNLFFLIWLGYIPAVGLTTILVSRMIGTFTPSFVFAGVWMVLFAIAGTRLSGWRCPRCGKPFSRKSWYDKGLLARKCVHCGLAKFG
jgi:hypothetical protein